MEKFSNMKFNITLLAVLMSTLLWAQEAPLFVAEPTQVYHMPSIAYRIAELPPSINKEGKVQDGRASKNTAIIGKDPQTSPDALAANPNALKGKLKTREASLVFDAYSSSSSPTDPSLAVGPNHVFVVFNTGFIIYDKEGNALTEQTAPSSIFGTDGCCDLTASYDFAADRWVISLLGSGAYVAVSDSSDPVNAGWTVYQYAQVSDYQKLSVWSDGYYMTDNTSSSNNVYVFERDKMLEGDNSARILAFGLTGLTRSGFYSPQALNVTGGEMPAPGNAPVIYFQDDAWSGVTEDHIKIWTINVDWEDTTNSTISEPTELLTTPFVSNFDGGGFSNLTQPNGGEAIDAIQGTVMNQAQFRKFNTYNSALFNFVVDTDTSSEERAGVRWYELRQSGDGEAWEIYQEGTYTSPDNKHAWMASMAMDDRGNIGMGYTGMGGDNEQVVSSYYTGRRESDPLNTMTFEETLIAQGNGNIPNYRYGDYSKIDVDPVNNEDFWFINEYYNSGRKGVVGLFKLAPNYDNDIGVASIDAPESGILNATTNVSVTITNYGTLPQSNFPVYLKVNDVLLATETFTGTLEAENTAQFDFAATIDLGTEGSTYTIESGTQLSNDQDTENDATIKEVTYVYSNDVGVTAITSPDTASNLGSQEIKIVVRNMGTQTQTSIPVYYTINGGAQVLETIATSLEAGAEYEYTFSTPYNFANVGVYTILASTNLSNDSVTENDSFTKEVINTSCMDETVAPNIPFDDSTSAVSVISIAESSIINDVNITLNIEHTWDGDITAKLTAPDGTEVILFSGVGSLGDNFTNTTLDDDAEMPLSSGEAPYTGTFQPQNPLSVFNGLNSQGDWTLTLEDDYASDSGVLLDWTLNICNAGQMSTHDFVDENIDFVVANRGNDQFWINYNKSNMSQDKATVEVFNMEGKLLLTRKLEKISNGFEYELDMSYAAPGVYIIRLSNQEINGVKRIIVK